MRAHEFVTEKKRKKRRPRWAAYGPGPYGGYGFYAGYSGDSGEGGDGGGKALSMKTLPTVRSPDAKDWPSVVALIPKHQ